MIPVYYSIPTNVALCYLLPKMPTNEITIARTTITKNRKSTTPATILAGVVVCTVVVGEFVSGTSFESYSYCVSVSVVLSVVKGGVHSHGVGWRF